MIVARGLGALMIAATGFLVGRFLAEPYRQRIRGLIEWASFLDRLNVELTFRQRPLVDAFKTSATTTNLHTAAERLQRVLDQNGSLEEASQSAVLSDSRLGGEEQGLLAALIPPLAISPARWQGESLHHGAEEITRILNQIRDESGKKARMVETLSTLAGLTAVLLLL